MKTLPDVPELWYEQDRESEEGDEESPNDRDVECCQVDLDWKELRDHNNDREEDNVAACP